MICPKSHSESAVEPDLALYKDDSFLVLEFGHSWLKLTIAGDWLFQLSLVWGYLPLTPKN